MISNQNKGKLVETNPIENVSNIKNAVKHNLLVLNIDQNCFDKIKAIANYDFQTKQ